MSGRLDGLRSLIIERGLDGVLVTDGYNRRYLSGYTAHDHAPNELAGVLLIGWDTAQLFTSPNNTDWAASEATGFEVLPWQRPWVNTVAERVQNLGWTRLGFEDDSTLFSTHRDLSAKLTSGITLEPLGDAIDRLRSIKQPDELATLQRAFDATDQAFNVARASAKPGMTEHDLAWIIELALHDAGADGPAFSIAVASGPNAARPHHKVGDRPFAAGEPITIDMGASVGGYNGDLTRTFWFGDPGPTLAEVYNVVWNAQQAALAGLRAGITGKEGDALAREVIAAAGYGDRFVHGLGHGLGVRIHEGPSLSVVSDHVLRPGEVVTVEPGIYIPGWGGVRIEDVVVIEENGCRVMTHAPKVSPAEGPRERIDR